MWPNKGLLSRLIEKQMIEGSISVPQPPNNNEFEKGQHKIPKYESTHQSSMQIVYQYQCQIHYSVSSSYFSSPEITTIDSPFLRIYHESWWPCPDLVENGKRENSQHISLYLLTPFTTTELSLVATSNSDSKI